MADRKLIPGKFVWYELQCSDVPRAQAFYAELLGWKNVRFPAGAKPLEHKIVKAAIAEAEQRLNGAGRILVRASGTEPLIRIMAEGDDERMVKAVVNAIASAVEEAATAG